MSEETTKQQPIADTNIGVQSESTTLIERADQVAQRIEQANKRAEELLNRQEQILSRQLLSGRAEAGTGATQKTDAEIKAEKFKAYFKGTALERVIK